jgi:dihydropyrimidine dehydrogenase (NAD+) subunit PreA
LKLDGAAWCGRRWAKIRAVNVSSRYSAHYGKNREVLGFNNIELITDRPLEINLQEITQVKKDWPDRVIIVSLMLPCEENCGPIFCRKWKTGAGIELNFGCPHGMPERGMGAAVGQVPEYVEMVTRWCKTHSKLPVIVKLTPNITDVAHRPVPPKPVVRMPSR